MPGVRNTAVANFMFNLNGVPCGFVKDVGGGDVAAEVIAETGGPSFFTKKHIGPPRYEDFALQIGFGLAHDLYEWIAASWAANYQRKDGSIVGVDATLRAHSEREFFHASITETTIPALDASSKEAAYLTIKFAPEYTRSTKASGKIGAPSKQQTFLASNFRLELDQLDCTRVTGIDSFTVEQAVVPDDIGDGRHVTEPGKIDFPNLRVTIAENTATTWESWFEDFVIKGNNGDPKEKDGAIVFLSADLKSELARVVLHNVGIFALHREARQATVTLGLYCERMEFRLAGAKPL